MNILNLIFPKTCLDCGKEGKYLCENCLTKVKILKPACPCCEKASIDGFTHVKCRKKYGLDGLTSIWDYDGVVKKAILALKYKYSTEAGRELSSIFVDALKTRNSLFMINNSSVLVPIPIHWHRENVRGFNQSIEIGKIVAHEMGWKFIPDLLIKKKSTTSQVDLSVEDRKQNLQGVFSLNPIHKSSFINLKSVIIFDDVFTTGSTLKEAAKVLKHTGVKNVWGLTIAR
jgi:competence protein ComFC